MQIINDYWRDMSDQAIDSKPIEKVEIELSAGVWTDITDEYLGGATFDQEKERAPDKISAGDTRYSFDNSDDKFTPTDSGSIFYQVIYQGQRIRFSTGFYGIGYYPQSIMQVKDVQWDYDEQIIYMYCQELMQRVVDEDLNVYPSGLVPVLNPANTGNGTITKVQTMPFAVVSENWTLTCTTGGGDAVGIFSVVGFVSGNIGNATSGTEFSDTTAGIKFTIKSGGTVWVAGGSPDTITFSTYQYPEWTTTNPAKIIYSLLTGYDYDSGTADDWSARVLDLDHTQSDANTDINWNSFVNAVASIDNNLTGYIPYNKNAARSIEEIVIHFLGAIFSDNKGRVTLSAFKPSFGDLIIREFSDDKKVFKMNVDSSTFDMINKVTVNLKRDASWAWSGDSETTDDIYTNENTTSISNYGLRNPFNWTDYWYSAGKIAQKWFADRIIDKFGDPPNKITFETGLDAIRTNLGDIREFTDSATNYSKLLVEITKTKRDFEADYKVITLEGTDTNTTGIRWIFLGSSADEGDGISPQNNDYDSATDTDKQFCYLSQTGGEGNNPEYYLF